MTFPTDSWQPLIHFDNHLDYHRCTIIIVIPVCQRYHLVLHQHRHRMLTEHKVRFFFSFLLEYFEYNAERTEELFDIILQVLFRIQHIIMVLVIKRVTRV